MMLGQEFGARCVDMVPRDLKAKVLNMTSVASPPSFPTLGDILDLLSFIELYPILTTLNFKNKDFLSQRRNYLCIRRMLFFT